MQESTVLDIVDFDYEDGQIYFIASNTPFIWQYNCIKGNIMILTEFPSNINVAGAFARLIKVKQKIYCIPCFADNIYCYDLVTNQFYSLNIPDELFCKMPKRKIIEPFIVNGNLYCICRSPHYIYEINIENDAYDIYKVQGTQSEHNFFSIKCYNGVIEYPHLNNQIISFDTRNKSFYFRTLYESDIKNCPEEKNIFNFEYDSIGGIWWCDFNGDVYRSTKSEMHQVKMPDEFYGKYQDVIGRERPGINGIELINENICFILASDYKILQYDLFKSQFTWSQNPDNECFRNKEIYFHYNKLSDKSLLLYSRDKKIFYIWNIEKGFLNQFVIKISADILARNRFFDSYISIKSESNDINLQFYLEFVKCFEDRKEKLLVMEEKNGREIYISSDK